MGVVWIWIWDWILYLGLFGKDPIRKVKMASSSEFCEFSGQRQGKLPEKASFSQRCSLLSQYLKEKGSFGDLSLGMTCNIESNGTFLFFFYFFGFLGYSLNFWYFGCEKRERGVRRFLMFQTGLVFSFGDSVK